jgi:hypothetical protein
VPAGRSTNTTAAQPELAPERLCGPAGTRPGSGSTEVCAARCLLPIPEKGTRMAVTIGVDPHKASHTAAALLEHGRLLGQQRIPATGEGYRTLQAWAGP